MKRCYLRENSTCVCVFSVLLVIVCTYIRDTTSYRFLESDSHGKTASAGKGKEGQTLSVWSIILKICYLLQRVARLRRRRSARNGSIGRASTSGVESPSLRPVGGEMAEVNVGKGKVRRVTNHPVINLWRAAALSARVRGGEWNCSKRGANSLAPLGGTRIGAMPSGAALGSLRSWSPLRDWNVSTNYEISRCALCIGAGGSETVEHRSCWTCPTFLRVLPAHRCNPITVDLSRLSRISFNFPPRFAPRSTVRVC